ncbi:hypothetical protein AXG93_1962s1310 [Marchantia polymorpha subsp. ruderalis]|uniref:Uncharacterized protein n=1 Tax=Marchantia polymorpha subsp. ruderalis TaxID=1480154 RepID=A0A176WEC7_MARPO|nr:hypothetical protein AXG93_1962s1310 [Marchantia polymorpha subsp. ruderalis]
MASRGLDPRSRAVVSSKRSMADGRGTVGLGNCGARRKDDRDDDDASVTRRQLERFLADRVESPGESWRGESSDVASDLPSESDYHHASSQHDEPGQRGLELVNPFQVETPKWS